MPCAGPGRELTFREQGASIPYRAHVELARWPLTTVTVRETHRRPLPPAPTAQLQGSNAGIEASLEAAGSKDEL